MKNYFKFFIVVILIFFFNYINIISYINYIIYYIKTQNDIKKMKNYFTFTNHMKFNSIKKKKQIKNPKISIVSPIYNRERYLIRLLESIQYQRFNNIEIVIIDDYSIDNSSNIIKYFQKIDERIKLIKNKSNKGTFISRNIGVLYSKGTYIILPDPDDILSKDILNICYKYAEKYHFNLIRFKHFNGDKVKSFNPDDNNNKLIYQPALSTIIFYGSNELQQTDYYINNKFIEKKIYIKALNIINRYYLSLYMIYMEDQIMNYFLHITAKSFYFLKKIGYYYIKNSISITMNGYKIINLRILLIFLLLKLLGHFILAKGY